MGLSVPPMGLAYIASSLLEAGHEVEILDAYALGWSETGSVNGFKASILMFWDVQS